MVYSEDLEKQQILKRDIPEWVKRVINDKKRVKQSKEEIQRYNK